MENGSSAEKKRKLDAEEIRKKLDHYLVKLPSQLRRKLWIEYKTEAKKKRNVSSIQLPDLCLFLNCILDNSFEELDFIHPMAPDNQDSYPIKLMEIITQRCPLLTSFTFVCNKWNAGIELETQFAQSFKKLRCLTKLRINWYEPASDCIHLFANLGHSCPQLKQLGFFSSVPFGLVQQMALLLGSVSELFPYSQLQNLHTLRFAEECVTPLCHSLEK